MDKASLTNQWDETDYPVTIRSARASESSRLRRDVSSKRKLATRARYRRDSGSTGCFGGAHRRRQKRNGL